VTKALVQCLRRLEGSLRWDPLVEQDREKQRERIASEECLRSLVNARQLQVLSWIAEGCPDDVMASDTHRVTARAGLGWKRGGRSPHLTLRAACRRVSARCVRAVYVRSHGARELASE